MKKLSNIKVNLQLPYIGGIEGNWQPDEREQHAAWEIYIELVTRVPLSELRNNEGSLREALSSLHSLFNITRNILRQYGPTVAQSKGQGTLSFGYLAVAILNTVLRPVLAKWHPILLHYEYTKPLIISIIEHERQWDKSEELRQVLNDVQDTLTNYANLLAQVANVPSLIINRPECAENS